MHFLSHQIIYSLYIAACPCPPCLPHLHCCKQVLQPQTCCTFLSHMYHLAQCDIFCSFFPPFVNLTSFVQFLLLCSGLVTGFLSFRVTIPVYTTGFRQLDLLVLIDPFFFSIYSLFSLLYIILINVQKKKNENTIQYNV